MFSAYASGGSFIPSKKNTNKIRKYCAKGRVDKLEKLKSNGYLTKIHGWGKKTLGNQEERLEEQDYITRSILDGFLDFYGDAKFQNLMTNFAVYFANELGYETYNLYEDDMGGRANCELSSAAAREYSLENIKKLVNAGHAQNYECVQTAIRSAEHRGYTQISNYLRSI